MSGSSTGGSATRPTRPARSAGLALVLTGIVLLAFQLRSPLVALSPVATSAELGFGVSSAGLGLLTSVPVLCFGLATPIAAILARRVGVEGAIEICLGGVVIATVLRSVGPFPLAVASVVLLGVAITIGNVLVPTIIRRDVPERGRALVTGGYVVALNIGTMLTSIATVPLAQVLGWRAAAAAWSVIGVATIGLWLVLLRRQRAVTGDAQAQPKLGRLRPDVLAWLLGIAFAAQAFSYYGITPWLPSLLGDERHLSAATAGTASAVFQVAGVIGALGVPVLALRVKPWVSMAIVGALWIVMPTGLLVAPEHYIIVSILGGAAQGGGFAAIFTIIAGVGRGPQDTTRLSAFVQTVGYLIGATAPPIIGGLHTVTGGWTLSMTVVVGSTTVFLVTGVLAAVIAGRRTAAAREQRRTT